ncbi:DMT family transporter [Uliginosibacterium sp. 31-16]|uniref:DMT family transporter n=1 Tax=Uliginosibacterium sp. 31-16 TaxID=3068315 RepID=UPI00273D0B8A|nr:DMT family transporter [Uliginosibacterium sp. 31-16]MDP5238579.1 DMT family transporter [Uliginosibacterium sp. 31-16]
MKPARASFIASLALVFVTLFWGTTFPAMKAVSQQMPPGLMVGARWALAALALAPFIDWRDRRLWRDAVLLVMPLFASFVLQVLGLTLMSAGRNAFITGLNVILVPLLMPFLGGRLNRRASLAAALATAGIVVMSYEQGAGWLGDLLTLACAVAFAIYVLGMERFAPRHSALSLAGAQAVVMTLFAPLWIAGEWLWWGEAYPAMAAGAETVWRELLYLGIVCSGLVLILQTWAQARASAVQAAVIYALEPFFAAVFAAWWLGEVFGVRGMAGGALVIVAMVVSQWPARRHAGAEHPHVPN